MRPVRTVSQLLELLLEIVTTLYLHLVHDRGHDNQASTWVL